MKKIVKILLKINNFLFCLLFIIKEEEEPPIIERTKYEIKLLNEID